MEAADYRNEKKEKEYRILALLQEALGAEFSDIVPREQPDFVVRHYGSELGIEVTDGSMREFNWGSVLAERKGLSSICVNRFEYQEKGQAPRERDDVIRSMTELEYTETEPAAVAWAARIAEKIRRKCGLLEKGEIKRFERNWLCIYNFQSDDRGLEVKDPESEVKRYRDMLMGALGPDPKYRCLFDMIYVVSQWNIFLIDRIHFLGYSRKR